MNKAVFVLLLLSLVAVPAVVAQGRGSTDDGRVVTSSSQYVGDKLCAGFHERARRLGHAWTDGMNCRVTTTVIASDGPVDSPIMRQDGIISTQAASGCTSRHPYKFCRFNVRHARNYEVRYCYGYAHGDHRCKQHINPTWFYVRQGGRYWRGETCRHSVAFPYPQDCAARFAWTKDNNWHRGSFHTHNRSGWHWCQRVTSSGAKTEIDSCRIIDVRDPADIRSRYGGDRWKADKGRVQMRWTVDYSDLRQTRSGTSWIRLFPSGLIRAGGSW